MLAELGRSQAPDPEALRRVLALPVDVWRVFLALERCALEVRDVLDRAAKDDSAPGPVQDYLRELATRELQRFLSARGQLQRLGALARDEGIRFVVLKGGVEVAERRPVALDDVDLLVGENDLPQLQLILDREGYASWGEETDWNPPGRNLPDQVPIDLHRAIRLLDDHERVLARAVPSSLPGVMKPHSSDRLWHLLVHSVHYHPDRRGRVRDLVLVARAVAECDDRDLSEVESVVRRHPLSEPLRAKMAMGRELARGPIERDRFRDAAVGKYHAALRLESLVRGERTALFRTLVIRSLCADRSFVDELRDLGDRPAGWVALARRVAGVSAAAMVSRWFRWEAQRFG